MVESTDYRILVIGKLGVGKSTLLNIMYGQEQFLTSFEPSSCTHKFESSKIPGKEITVIDSPGLCDCDIPLPSWVTLFNKSTLKGSPVSKVILVFKETVRPDCDDMMVFAVIKELLQEHANSKGWKNTVQEHLAVVTTFCNEKSDASNLHVWINKAVFNMFEGSVPSALFLYKDGETEQEELINWLNGMKPQSAAMLTCKLELSKLLVTMETYGGSEEVKMLLQQIEEMHQALLQSSQNTSKSSGSPETEFGYNLKKEEVQQDMSNLLMQFMQQKGQTQSVPQVIPVPTSSGAEQLLSNIVGLGATTLASVYGGPVAGMATSSTVSGLMSGNQQQLTHAGMLGIQAMTQQPMMQQQPMMHQPMMQQPMMQQPMMQQPMMQQPVMQQPMMQPQPMMQQPMMQQPMMQQPMTQQPNQHNQNQQ